MCFFFQKQKKSDNNNKLKDIVFETKIECQHELKHCKTNVLNYYCRLNIYIYQLHIVFGAYIILHFLTY